MKHTISALALGAALAFAGAASAQPSGGPDAKGNAPLKHAHTVNDGAAKHGANSFTEGQARTHIEKAGFTGVTGLAKGQDGVWRGQAMRDGKTVDVAMDFKGNVTTAGDAPAPHAAVTHHAARPAPAPMPMAAPAPAAADESTSTTTTTNATTTEGSAMHHHMRRHHRHHRRHHRHHVMSSCANPAPNGAACSGVDRNANGISDKEDRATGK